MLNAILRFALRQRLLIAVLSMTLLAYGGWEVYQFVGGGEKEQPLRIDVFPDLDRPRVTIMTEAPGMAPEEVETLITFPLERSLNGATGVQAVRTTSSVGLSIIYVEFDWGTDPYTDRQIVNERISLVADHLPEGIVPQLAPVSSVMGQIMIVGMWSEGGKTSPMELRTLADWSVRQRLRTIPGVSQVFVIGGDLMQFQVLVDPDKLLKFGVTLQEVKTAVQESNANATGGYLDEQGPNELLVRGLGRISSIEQLKEVVVKIRDGRSVLLEQVARVIKGAHVKRGDSTAYVRDDDGRFTGGRAVALTINKQPKADTRLVTQRVVAALEELQASMPDDVHIHTNLYQQKQFIDLAIHNVVEALRDGGILVVIILFVFLVNFRTTFITLTAIPLSVIITSLIFKWFDLSINTMTLGGLAVAIGELVDDAIVDVENIYRRLRENRHSENPKPALLVTYQASVEIRNPIFFGTMIVVLVFLPVFALSGMEGRLFAPLGIAYIVSILSSLLVSLTLTPVLSYWLLSKIRHPAQEKDSVVLLGFKWLAGWAIRRSLKAPALVLLVALAVVGGSAYALLHLENDFLPPFDEGVVQLNVILPPGTSLATSTKVAAQVDRRLQKIDDLAAFVRKTGRAELDEHAASVNFTEVIASFDPHSTRSRADILKELRDAMKEIPGVVVAVDQPLQHLISHTLSGVQAQVAIKLYGDDLDTLRSTAKKMKSAISGVPGVEDLQVEQLADIPQLRIEIDGHRLAQYGLRRADINEFIETGMQGADISDVLIGQRTFEILVRFNEPFRENRHAIERLSIELPDGGTTTLGSVARIYEAVGPNKISREQVRRRIVLSCNTAGRGLVDVVNDIKKELKPIEASLKDLPGSYFVEYGGQFESQQTASRKIAIYFICSLVGMFLVLHAMFRSANLALQVMVAVPLALIGSVAALYITGQTLTVAAMVGFISLCGIASRNGILLINHYLHLVEHEGENFTTAMIVRAGQERVAPVLMTALTSGIGLVPLAMAAGEPGKEILYPVATVIIGGLISSTLLEFLVRPALFWTFGVGAGKHLVSEHSEEIPLETDE